MYWPSCCFTFLCLPTFCRRGWQRGQRVNCWASVGCPGSVKTFPDKMGTNELAHVLIKLHGQALKFVFCTIWTCRKILFFFDFFSSHLNYKTIFSLRAIQKTNRRQATGQIWLIGCSLPTAELWDSLSLFLCFYFTYLGVIHSFLSLALKSDFPEKKEVWFLLYFD